MEDIPLPQNWLTVQLGDIASVQSGVGFPKKYQGKSGERYPVYKVGDISKAVLNANGILKTAEHTVTEEDVVELKGKLFPIGSTLFAKIGEAVKLNRRAYVNMEGLADNNVMGVTCFLFESNKFINYFMRTVDLRRASRSTTVPSIRKGDIEGLVIHLPPLAEQKQIAARLDALLAQVDTLKARLDAIPAILKRFRQSVLAAAVSGRLTDSSREYDCAPFGELIHEMKNGLSSKPNEDGRGYPILRISSVRPFAVNEEDVRYLECDVKTRIVYALKRDDLLFTRYNGSLDFVGVCGRNKQNIYDTLLYPDKLIRVRTKHDVLLPGYAEIFFSAPQVRKVVASFIKSTSGQKGISGKDLKSILVDFPLVEEQTEIVRRVEQLFAFADQIEQRVRDAQARVNQLTQSILAKAFRGELTAGWREQNPDLISGENSAQALLERIQAEQKKIKPVKKKRVSRKGKAALS